MLHAGSSDNKQFSEVYYQGESERYFVDIVRIFSALGYTGTGKISLDGTKIKGNASAKWMKDRERFEKWLSGWRVR